MIDFGLEGLEEIGKTITKMVDKIDHFGKQDMPDELVFWQTDDMRRQRPNTETPDDKTAETQIWQRSNVAASKKGRRKRRRRRARRLKPYNPSVADRKWRRSYRRSRGSPLPRIGGVLRVELFTTLCDRMRDVMKDKITWRT